MATPRKQSFAKMAESDARLPRNPPSSGEELPSSEEGTTPVAGIGNSLWTKRCRSPVWSLGTFLLLEVLVLGRLWVWHDLPRGDTASYYRYASAWAVHGGFRNLGPLVFSPLYLIFLGTLQRLFPDPCVVVMLHRYLIVAGTGLLVLLVLRRLLPHPWSWLIAAWWLLLPINHDSYFEVHLFCFGWVLAACWISSFFGLWGVGISISLILASTLLLRNEYAPALLLMGAVSVLLLFSGKEGTRPLWARVVPLLLPSACVLVATGLFVAASFRDVTVSGLRSVFRARENLDLSQVFSYGYQQRHPEWTSDPWTQGDSLLREKFGKDHLTWSEALVRNPPALLEHFAWNARLLPDGLEYGLFNIYAGSVSPDFSRKGGGRTIALVALLLFAALCLFPIVTVRSWWRAELLRQPKARCWITLICFLPSALIAIETQRPRPSYMFPLTFFLMALCGLSLARLSRRLFTPRTEQTLGCLGIAVALVLAAQISTHRVRTRPVADDVARLAPHGELLAGEQNGFCSNAVWGDDLIRYAATPGVRSARFIPWTAVAAKITSGEDLDAAAQQAGVTVFYLKSDPTLGDAGRRLLNGDVASWRIVSRSSTPERTGSEGEGERPREPRVEPPAWAILTRSGDERVPP